MEQIIDAFNDLITDHWVKFVTAGAFTAVGWLIARRRAASEWKQREFYHRLNFSLNSVIDGTLKIRTLAEKSCREVFLNDAAVRQLTRLAQETRPGNPILPIPKDDCWYFLNAALNELSEQFADGLIAREAGRPVTAVNYLICLTNESDGDVRTRKIRALVVRKSLLTDLPKETPAFESPNHRIRWQTLQFMAQTWQKEPWRFLEVELIAP